MPMNLVSLELLLDGPIPRGAEVRLRHPIKPLTMTGASTFARFDTTILVGDAVLGTCSLTAQLLTKEAYLEMRQHPTNANASR